MGYVVRPAESKDIEEILPQLKKFSEFYGTSHELYGKDLAHSYNVLDTLINQHFFSVVEIDQKIIGFIAGTLAPHFFNNEITVLSEVFWWVNEEHRSNRAGALLFQEFMDFGKANADWITMTIEHHSPVKEESLLKRGFSLQEKSYLMEVR